MYSPLRHIVDFNNRSHKNCSSFFFFQLHAQYISYLKINIVTIIIHFTRHVQTHDRHCIIKVYQEIFTRILFIHFIVYLKKYV